MAASHEHIPSILQAVGRIQSVRGDIDEESWIARSLEEIDETLWSIVETLVDEGRIAT